MGGWHRLSFSPYPRSTNIATATAAAAVAVSTLRVMSSTTTTQPPPPPSQEKEPTSFEWIKEGSARMKVPRQETPSSLPGGRGGKAADAAATPTSVFYNPVQVQNRDLSVLMIALHLERRAVRHELKRFRKNWHKQQQNQQHPSQRQPQQAKSVDAGAAAKEEAPPPPSPPAAAAPTLQQALDDYERTLDPAQLVRASTTHEPGEEDEGQGEPLPPPKGAVILDALAASGLRSLRYWKEIPGIHHITINDLDPAAVERAHQNVTDNALHNDLIVEAPEPLKAAASSSLPLLHRRGLCIHQGDATSLLYATRDSRPWTIVDLDPYGSAASFLDAAIQSIEHQGMMCVTCTDMAALGGSRPETCFGRYHAMPIQRAGYLQEMALRILLYHIATTASKYGRSIRPILSVGMDFYVRVFVEIWDSKAEVNQLPLHIGNVYQSTQCPSFHIVPTAILGGQSGKVWQAGRAPHSHCEETGAVFKVGGPLWLGPLHDPIAVREALQRLALPESAPFASSTIRHLATKDRLQGLLESCRDELNDVPLYYKLPDLASTLKVSCPPMVQMRAALRNAGYKVSGYHKEPQALKTNATNRVVWDALRVWCQSHLPNPPTENTSAAQILAVPPTTHIDFVVRRRSNDRGAVGAAASPTDPSTTDSRRHRKVARFPLNPQPHWGPKPRATGHRKRKAGEKEDNADKPPYKPPP